MNATAGNCECDRDAVSDQDGWAESVICKHCLCLVREKHAGGEMGDRQSEPNKLPEPDARAVYLALKGMSIFRPGSACNRIRIRKAIRRQRLSESVKPLLDKHGIDAIAAKTQELFEDQVFTNVDAARDMFPDLFMEPVCLPLTAQRPLVAALRQALIYASFTYVQRYEPSALQARDWNCPDAAELVSLLAVIKSLRIDLEKPALDRLMSDITKALVPEPMEISKVRETLRAAEVFLNLLGIESGKGAITLLRAGAEAELDEFITQVLSHQAKKREEMRRIAAERAELEQREKAAIKALQDEERFIWKAITADILQSAHEVETSLMKDFFAE